MSKFYDTAQALATHLSTVPSLKHVPVMVDRQQELSSELRKAIGKQSGCLAVVTWAGAKNEDLSSDGPNFTTTYTVHLFSKPVIRAGEIPADDVMQAIATALHDYRVKPTDPYSARLVVTDIDPVPHEELLIYQLTLTTPNQL
jgi:hypothetical protein